jgi:hypothetical protein
MKPAAQRKVRDRLLNVIFFLALLIFIAIANRSFTQKIYYLPDNLGPVSANKSFFTQ